MEGEQKVKEGRECGGGGGGVWEKRIMPSPLDLLKNDDRARPDLRHYPKYRCK